MERTRWTDERIDDLAATMRDGFDRMDRRFEQVHAELRELRQWMFRLTMGTSLGFISVLSLLATILARGS
jgi:hypothetical protein